MQTFLYSIKQPWHLLPYSRRCKGLEVLTFHPYSEELTIWPAFVHSGEKALSLI